MSVASTACVIAGSCWLITDAALIRVEDSADGGKRCMTGRTTGTTCGTIEDADTYVDTEHGGQIYRIHHLVKVKGIVLNDGDSGGPAYWHNTNINVVKAAGFLSSKDEVNDKAWFTPAQKLEQLGWDITIATLSSSNGCKIPGLGGPSPKCPVDAGGDY